MKLTLYITSSLITFILISSSVVSATEQKIIFPMSKGDKSIVLEFSGEVYNKTTSINISDESTHAIATFINKLIVSNASGDKNKILNLWSDNYKKEIDLVMSDPKRIERNAALFRNMKSSKLMGYIEYGEYIICYVYHDINNGQGEVYLKEYPIKLTSKGYVLTNDLSKDIFFSQISYNLAQHIWQR